MFSYSSQKQHVFLTIRNLAPPHPTHDNDAQNPRILRLSAKPPSQAASTAVVAEHRRSVLLVGLGAAIAFCLVHHGVSNRVSCLCGRVAFVLVRWG